MSSFSSPRLFSSAVPLPSSLLLPYIPLFIQSPHSAHISSTFPSFLSHLAFTVSILIPHSCALTSAQPQAGRSPSHRLPSTLSMPTYPSLLITAFLYFLLQVLFPLGLHHLEGMVHAEFYQQWWHKASSTESSVWF